MEIEAELRATISQRDVEIAALKAERDELKAAVKLLESEEACHEEEISGWEHDLLAERKEREAAEARLEEAVRERASIAKEYGELADRHGKEIRARESASLQAAEAQRRLRTVTTALQELRSYVASVWFDEAVATDEERELMASTKSALKEPK